MIHVMLLKRLFWICVTDRVSKRLSHLQRQEQFHFASQDGRIKFDSWRHFFDQSWKDSDRSFVVLDWGDWRYITIGIDSIRTFWWWPSKKKNHWPGMHFICLTEFEYLLGIWNNQNIFVQFIFLVIYHSLHGVIDGKCDSSYHIISVFFIWYLVSNFNMLFESLFWHNGSSVCDSFANWDLLD